MKRDEYVSNGWYSRFCERNPELSRRRAQALDRYRIKAINKNATQEYFNLIKLVVDRIKELSNGVDLTANRIYSADEVGFDLNSRSGYIMTKGGVKNDYIISSGNSTHLSIMSSILATEISIEPYFILPGIRTSKTS